MPIDAVPNEFIVLSSNFKHQEDMSAEYTCEGKDISPHIKWKNVPAGTKSFVLIIDDPDAPDPAAPQRTWVHWVLYNIPASATELEKGVTAAQLPTGTKQGLNDWNKVGYGGPCPPIGKHRYFHKLYALDTVLPDLGTPTKAELTEAIKPHVIGVSEIIGLYQKSN